MKTANLLAVSALALLVAPPAVAQGALTGVDTLDDRIDDIRENVSDEFADADDSARFGPDAFTQGWTGSVALGFTATSGNTDTSDLSLGGRFRYGQGLWSHTFGFAAEFAEESGTETREDVFVTYDVNRCDLRREPVFHRSVLCLRPRLGAL